MYINYKKQSSFLSYCEDKALWQKQIQGEGVHSAHSSGLQSITAQKFEWQDCEAAGHITSAVGEKESNGFMQLLGFHSPSSWSSESPT